MAEKLGYKDYSKTNIRPSFYALFYPKFREIAVQSGYAIAIHGSMASDMDLIAVAWTTDAIPAEELANKICEAGAGTMYDSLHPSVTAKKPHGRVVYTISIFADWYFDLSIMGPINN